MSDEMPDAPGVLHGSLQCCCLWPGSRGIRAGASGRLQPLAYFSSFSCPTRGHCCIQRPHRRKPSRSWQRRGHSCAPAAPSRPVWPPRPVGPRGASTSPPGPSKLPPKLLLRGPGFLGSLPPGEVQHQRTPCRPQDCSSSPPRASPTSPGARISQTRPHCVEELRFSNSELQTEQFHVLQHHVGLSCPTHSLGMAGPHPHGPWHACGE